MDILDELRLTTVALRDREALLERRGMLAVQAREAGYSWEEIRRAMGVSRQAAMTAAFRAKERVKKAGAE